ncbi:unnamed protein product [Cunninghamella echinulata]
MITSLPFNKSHILKLLKNGGNHGKSKDNKDTSSPYNALAKSSKTRKILYPFVVKSSPRC